MIAVTAGLAEQQQARSAAASARAQTLCTVVPEAARELGVSVG